MVKMSYDVVKRWVNEAQEAASSDNIMVQVSCIDICEDFRIYFILTHLYCVHFYIVKQVLMILMSIS